MKLKKISLYLLIFILIPTQIYSFEKDQKNPLDISIGTVQTKLEQAALRIVLKSVKKIDKNYLIINANKNSILDDKGWLFDISPDVDIRTGGDSSFNGVVAKLTGNYIRFKTTDIAGITTPCSACLFHVFPINLGFESNRNFENTNAIVEIGYVPFYLNPKSRLRLGLKNKVGIFAQGGYKFKTNQSSKKEIARVKLDVKTDIDLIRYSNDRYNIKLIPKIDLWYDMIDFKTYYKYEAVLRFSLNSNRSFDLKYESGSSAPDFIKDELFSVNISFRY